MTRKSARAFAPASVGNAAVGFDILGFSFPVVGDEVEVSIDQSSKKIIIEEITGLVTELPKAPEKNTATLALLTLQKALNLDFGFHVKIKKGISLGSGMGGSAASAVAAVVAANHLLDKPLPKEKLLPFAIEGEVAASGGRHADNVAPSLLGGLCLVIKHNPTHVISLPWPEEVHCILWHPHLEIKTSEARALLKKEISLQDFVDQSACLAGFISGCFKKDLALIKECLHDLIIEPQRQILIPGFQAAKTAALQHGALGFSISGSGPSVFAWAKSFKEAQEIEKQVSSVFKAQKLPTDSWISKLSLDGARVLP